ncbi:hypothetical protein [Asticcacaulis taihuensis]|jgi:hypothetical protein|uniref:hypothetical protein n=1 Tax=Asticcacaulis taihuensis TaxID=260084 RepID=UPI003F7C53E8
MKREVFTTSSGEVSVWLDGGIHLKIEKANNDPAELSEAEAIELADILLKLAQAEL